MDESAVVEDVDTALDEDIERRRFRENYQEILIRAFEDSYDSLQHDCPSLYEERRAYVLRHNEMLDGGTTLVQLDLCREERSGESNPQVVPQTEDPVPLFCSPEEFELNGSESGNSVTSEGLHLCLEPNGEHPKIAECEECISSHFSVRECDESIIKDDSASYSSGVTDCDDESTFEDDHDSMYAEAQLTTRVRDGVRSFSPPTYLNFEKELARHKRAVLQAKSELYAERQRQVLVESFRRNLTEVDRMCEAELARLTLDAKELEPLNKISAKWECDKQQALWNEQYDQQGWRGTDGPDHLQGYVRRYNHQQPSCCVLADDQPITPKVIEEPTTLMNLGNHSE